MPLVTATINQTVNQIAIESNSNSIAIANPGLVNLSLSVTGAQGATGLGAEISTDDGNLITTGSDNGLLAILTTGNGLTIVGSEIRYDIQSLTRA